MPVCSVKHIFLGRGTSCPVCWYKIPLTGNINPESLLGIPTIEDNLKKAFLRGVDYAQKSLKTELYSPKEEIIKKAVDSAKDKSNPEVYAFRSGKNWVIDFERRKLSIGKIKEHRVKVREFEKSLKHNVDNAKQELRSVINQLKIDEEKGLFKRQGTNISAWTKILDLLFIKELSMTEISKMNPNINIDTLYQWRSRAIRFIDKRGISDNLKSYINQKKNRKSDSKLIKKKMVETIGKRPVIGPIVRRRLTEGKTFEQISKEGSYSSRSIRRKRARR